MGKISRILIPSALAMLCACTAEPAGNTSDDIPEGKVTLTLAFDKDSGTRSVAPYVTAQTYEKQVNSVQVFIFDANGSLNTYKDAGTSTTSISIGTTTGEKTVWAVVNGPNLSQVSDLEDFLGSSLLLSENSTTAAKGFVMCGNASCTVTSEGSTATIDVGRLVSRVALRSVTNGLPASLGSLTVDYVMLTNVVGNQSPDGCASVSTWYNRMGRKDGASSSLQIIDGSSHTATCPTLTFRSTGLTVSGGETLTPSTPYLFYCYPNPSSSDDTGWSSSFTARKTRLVVAATIQGVRYYYPVDIDSPARNTAYTIGMTITGLGSSDPDIPIEKGSASISISVQEWITEISYEETI